MRWCSVALWMDWAKYLKHRYNRQCLYNGNKYNLLLVQNPAPCQQAAAELAELLHSYKAIDESKLSNYALPQPLVPLT